MESIQLAVALLDEGNTTVQASFFKPFKASNTSNTGFEFFRNIKKKMEDNIQEVKHNNVSRGIRFKKRTLKP